MKNEQFALLVSTLWLIGSFLATDIRASLFMVVLAVLNYIVILNDRKITANLERK